MSQDHIPRDLSGECAFCDRPMNAVKVRLIGPLNIAVCPECIGSLIYDKLKSQGRWPEVKG